MKQHFGWLNFTLRTAGCVNGLQAYAERQSELVFNESVLLQTIGTFTV